MVLVLPTLTESIHPCWQLDDAAKFAEDAAQAHKRQITSAEMRVDDLLIELSDAVQVIPSLIDLQTYMRVWQLYLW